MNAIYHRPGRAYLGPEPVDGQHEGYRGQLVADSLGVHINRDCEYLGPAGDWQPVEIAVLVPWHRVFAIEWEARIGEEPHGS